MDKSSNYLKKCTSCLKLVSVEPFYFLTTLGLFVTMIPIQSLLMDRACRNTLGFSDSICDDIDQHKDAQKKIIEVGNNLYTGVMVATSLPAVVVAIFIGPWSDKYSRKWPLIFAVSGMFLESLFLILVTLNRTSAPEWYIVASLTSGSTGGFLVSASASSSYLSDITDERSRSTRFAFLDCSFVLASTLGTLAGGQIFEVVGYLPVLCTSTCLYLVALLYVTIFLKDTKPPLVKGERCKVAKDLLNLDNLKQSYYTCTKKRHGNIRLQIWLLMFVETCDKFVQLGVYGVGFSYAKLMYKMGVTEFSNVSAISAVTSALVCMILVPLLARKAKLHEAAIGLIGMLSLMSKMVIFSIAYTLPLFYMGLMSGTLFNCVGIAVQSRLSKLVGKDELGRAFSLLGTFLALAPMLGTAAFLQIYNGSLNVFPGLTFAAASLFLLPSVIILFWMMRLPTISLGDYGKEETSNIEKPLETISSRYSTLDNSSL